jgi:hypothetical protein
MPEMYHAHCFTEVGGAHLPPVLLTSVEEAWMYPFNPLRLVFPEIRITGTDDEAIYIHVVEGKLMFPTTKEMNLSQEKIDRMVEALKAGKVSL